MADAKPSRPNKTDDGETGAVKPTAAEKLVKKDGREYIEKMGSNGKVIRTFVDTKRA